MIRTQLEGVRSGPRDTDPDCPSRRCAPTYLTAGNPSRLNAVLSRRISGSATASPERGERVDRQRAGRAYSEYRGRQIAG